jgi:peptidoglycan/xylan/chitin deacetylase (PgdA/CDA1 family)
MKEAIITTSWDDGNPLDLKLAELLKKYDVPATFYIPIVYEKRGCMTPQQVREIAQSFDVGGHSYHHIRLHKIPFNEAEKEVAEGKKGLEEIIGREVFSFAYPYGNFNGNLMGIVKRANFIGARTVMLLSREIKEPFAMATMVNARNWWFTHYILHSLAAQDLNLFLFVLRNNLSFKNWDRIALSTLDFVVNNGGVWHLWGHSWEIEENSDWDRLESVLNAISKLPRRVARMDNTQVSRMRTLKSTIA